MRGAGGENHKDSVSKHNPAAFFSNVRLGERHRRPDDDVEPPREMEQGRRPLQPKAVRRRQLIFSISASAAESGQGR